MKRFPLLLLAVGLALVGCDPAEPASGDGTTVVASFYPLEFIATRIGGPDLEVVNLTPPGVEPHDIELTPGQVRTIGEADLVAYLGGGFQPAVEEVLTQVDVATMDASRAAGVRDGDPHVWLDTQQLSLIAHGIDNALVDLEGTPSAERGKRLEALNRELTSLDEEYRKGLADCARREIITSHEAFGYLAENYDLEQIGIAGLDPSSEPSPQRIAEVADLAEELDATTIFFETNVPQDIATTVAEEIGADTAVLDPLESAPARGDYFSAMRANLETLRDALGCR